MTSLNQTIIPLHLNQDQSSMINDDDWYQKEMNDIAAKKQTFFSSNCRNRDTSTHHKERNQCMKCNKGGQLLVCSSKACSFVFHDSCLASTSYTKGKFYCPFCIYSDLLSDYQRAQRKASIARNDVASFNGLVLKYTPQMSRKRLCMSDQIKPCTSLTITQRRRLAVPWTKSEEDTLKLLVVALQKYVEKFSRDCDGNYVPWRRILKLGVSVFQKGRTPVDLKDKWRNMQKATKSST